MLPIRDVSLFVKVMGEGYPLVLMHGGPGLDYTTLSSLEPLADQFTLVFYDHRANGRSSGATESMTWDNLTADADAIRKSLGFEEWSVLGHSFGGQVALEYALRYPDRISRLVLLDTGADQKLSYANAAEILRKRGYSRGAVSAVRRFFTGNLRPEEVRPTVMKFMKGYFYRMRLWDWPRALVAGSHLKLRPETVVFGFSTLVKDWSVMDRLDEIDIPTLVMSGRFDFLFPPEHQAILADRLPDARLEIIENAGHSPHIEQQDAVIGILRRFLSEPRIASRQVIDERRRIRHSPADALYDLV
jgi:proline iminopeptidase